MSVEDNFEIYISIFTKYIYKVYIYIFINIYIYKVYTP